MHHTTAFGQQLRDQDNRHTFSNHSLPSQPIVRNVGKPFEVNDYIANAADRQLRKLERNFDFDKSNTVTSFNSQPKHLTDAATEFNLHHAISKQIERERKSSSQLSSNWNGLVDIVEFEHGKAPMRRLKVTPKPSNESVGLPKKKLIKQQSPKPSVQAKQLAKAVALEGSLRYNKMFSKKRRSKNPHTSKTLQPLASRSPKSPKKKDLSRIRMPKDSSQDVIPSKKHPIDS